MNQFEQLVAAELSGLLRAGVPVRGMRLTVRELIVTRIDDRNSDQIQPLRQALE